MPLTAPPRVLQDALQQVLPQATLVATPLPGSPLQLWLIDPHNMERAFDSQETARILENPPYWCFCWASGLALAQWLLEHPHWVAGKRVLDFGSGSGVVAIAAAKAGAQQVLACDMDPLALLACQANAELNQVELSLSPSLDERDGVFDLVIVADVLYDRSNLPLLDLFVRKAPQVLVADSRIRDFDHPRYSRLTQLQASTWPDLAEPEEFRRVSLYQALAVGMGLEAGPASPQAMITDSNETSS